MNLFQNNARNWLVFPSRVILVPTIEWPFVHIKSNIEQPIYAEKSLLCKKIFFLWRKFFYAENSSMQKINYFMQKILLCRKIAFMQKKFF